MSALDEKNKQPVVPSPPDESVQEDVAKEKKGGKDEPPPLEKK